MERIEYDYPTYLKDLHKLAGMLPEDIDTIVAIGRGGMSMAHMLGEYLEIRKVFVINAIGYEDTKKLGTPKIFNIPDLKSSEKIVVVDDIADTGETLAEVMKRLKSIYPDKRFYTATLFYKRESSFKPDFWAKEAKGWIEFFWNEDLKRYNNSSNG